MADNRLKTGVRLNRRYRILEVLGQGGFGITYLAEDEALNQKVVVKEFFPAASAQRNGRQVRALAGEEKSFAAGMKGVLREARILASLFEIPGVVKVLDYFKENGTACIVMEYVKGVSLRTYLERTGKLFSFEGACSMLEPVLYALEQVHKKGLLHRDISPDNLIVDENGFVKLLDFGAARAFVRGSGQERTMTVLLKNGYAPPEQYEEKGGQGPWTDVYALCAVLYEMMTGCMPQSAPARQINDQLYAPSAYGAEITPEQEGLFLQKGLALDKRSVLHLWGRFARPFRGKGKKGTRPDEGFQL